MPVQLKAALADRSALIVVMGLGYAGLPIAVQLAAAGFQVTGLDPDEDRVRQIAQGKCYLDDISPELWKKALRNGRLQATSAQAVLRSADAVIVCVPTPLNDNKEPDTQFLVAAADSIATYQRARSLVVLQSTTYPGFTEEVFMPRLSRGNRVLGRDLFVAFSPERCDPGNQANPLQTTPKVISGCTPECLALAQLLYRHAVAQLVPVSSCRCAEMVKLLENTFRAVNIGLVNEMAIMSRKLGVDAFEVVRAAATKPFGFMPFHPGPGPGGHCIPIDPLYLSWKLSKQNYEARFIQLADEVNSAMPRYVVDRIREVLDQNSKCLAGSRILLYGLTYKRDVTDCRGAPILEISKILKQHGALLFVMDPLASIRNTPSVPAERVSPESTFSGYDLVVILTDHTALPRRRLKREAALILDTRDALREEPQHHESLAKSAPTTLSNENQIHTL